MPYRLLLADDEPGILSVLGIYLKDAGFDVRTVDNGKKALACIEQERFDIVLTDIRMPGLDGIALLKQIKKAHPDTEVVMITGHGDYKLAIESLKLDAVDFIPKPVDNDVLDIALKRAVEKIETRRELARYTIGLENMVAEKTRELEASRKRYAQLFNESPSFITIQDKHLNIVETNRMFREHIDFAPGMTCYAAYKKRQAPCPGCPVKKTFEDGRSHRAEMQIIEKDGRQRNILIQTSGITDAQGNLTHVMEMATDVTQIHELQDHLATLGLHIGSISHGIKQLITGVDGGSYLLESGLSRKDPGLIAEGWDIVKAKIANLRQMVLDILYHSKERKAEQEKIQLNALLKDLTESIRPAAERQGVALTVTLPAEDTALTLDRKSISAAFSSILENAVDACLDTDRKTKQISVAVQPENKGISIAIRDNGTGMPPEVLEKIFDPFFSQKDKKGTGLGLFIAHRAIRQAGGTIRVSSEPGKFTLFTVFLPVPD